MSPGSVIIDLPCFTLVRHHLESCAQVLGLLKKTLRRAKQIGLYGGYEDREKALDPYGKIAWRFLFRTRFE